MSYTFTIESTGGNGVVVPGYGFLLNNELTDFNYDTTTHPNRAEGDKRPRSSMAPTIIERDGKPYMAIGSPGGSTIPGTVLQTLVNRIDFGSRCRTRSRCRARSSATRRRRRPSRRSSTRQEGRDLVGVYGHTPFITPDDTDTLGATPEIGAATAIEFRGKRTMIAAAEPRAPRHGQRGGGRPEVARRLPRTGEVPRRH